MSDQDKTYYLLGKAMTYILPILGLVATATYYVYNEMNKKKRS